MDHTDHAQLCADVSVVLSKCETLLALSPETNCADEADAHARDIVYMLQDYTKQAQQLLGELEAQLRKCP